MSAQLPTLKGASDPDPLWRSIVNMIRAFMRDYAKLNLLLKEEETDDKTILMCLQLTVAELNSTPPPTSFSLNDLVQRGYTTIIVYGALVHIMESLMLLETRNHLNWQEGGQLIGLQDRTPLLSAHAKYFGDIYNYKMKEKKISDSINDAMDPGHVGVHSEYFVIHGYLWA
jgi:hypothetical protein